jgi:hypothetical protein
VVDDGVGVVWEPVLGELEESGLVEVGAVDDDAAAGGGEGVGSVGGAGVYDDDFVAYLLGDELPEGVEGGA